MDWADDDDEWELCQKDQMDLLEDLLS